MKGTRVPMQNKFAKQSELIFKPFSEWFQNNSERMPLSEKNKEGQVEK